MPSRTAAKSLRICAPATRFSSTVRFSNTRLPSKTWTTPRLTTSNGNSRSSRSPLSSTLPFVTGPRSVRNKPAIAFRVVDLPAPLAPRRVVMCPSSAFSETPFSTRTTPSYTTSMLLSASIGQRPLPLFGLADRLGDDLRIGAEPVGLLDELAVLDLEDLHPAAALMIGRGDLERRHQPTQGKVFDLLEALLHVLTGRLLAAVHFERVASRLDVEGGPQNATVVHHRVVHRLRRLPALRLVHVPDFVADRVVVADPGEGHRVIAFGRFPAAPADDVMFARGPHESDDL